MLDSTRDVNSDRSFISLLIGYHMDRFQAAATGLGFGQLALLALCWGLASIANKIVGRKQVNGPLIFLCFSAVILICLISIQLLRDLPADEIGQRIGYLIGSFFWAWLIGIYAAKRFITAQQEETFARQMKPGSRNRTAKIKARTSAKVAQSRSKVRPVEEELDDLEDADDEVDDLEDYDDAPSTKRGS